MKTYAEYVNEEMGKEDTPRKTESPLAIAKDFQRQIARLQRERERLFKKALRKLRIMDSTAAWDYFMNDQQGTCSFTEGLK